MAGASAQYVVDVAVSMPAGAATASQLDDLSQKLLASGASADNFHDAIAQVSDALAAAKQASASANEALATGNAAYRDLEQAALQASKAQEKAAKLGVVPPSVAANAAAATEAVNAYAGKLAALEATAKGAAADEAKLATQMRQVQQASAVGTAALAEQAKAQALTRKNVGDLKSGFAELGGPLGFLGAKSAAAKDSFVKLSAQFGTSGASALLAAAAFATTAIAVAAITVAIIAGTVAIAAWGIGLADTARTAGLHQDALEQLDPAYKSISGSLDDLTRDTGQSTAALDGLAKSLLAAKVPAEQLPDALRAAALAESALGQGGAQQFIDQIKAGTLSVNKFADAAQSKFGGIVAKQMLGLTAQSARLKTEIGQVFGGLNIDPVLAGVARLVALFDDSTAAGAAMKTIFENVFQPLINQVDKAATVIEAFVLGFLIGLTKLYIAAKPALKTLGAFFGFDNPATADSMATITAVAEKLVPVLVIMAAMFGVIVAVGGVALVAALAALAAPFVLVAALAYGAIAAFSYLRDKWAEITTFLGSISLADIGKGMLDGLVNGILGAGPAVLKALSGVVGDAVSSAKHLLGIASPSKVFAEIGMNTGAGMAQGLDGASSDVQASMAAVVAPPDTSSALSRQTAQQAPSIFGGGAKAAGTSSTSSDSSRSISLTGPFYFYGVEGAEDAESRFGEMLTRALEGDATQLGASPEASP